jgi:hypothetical protein
MTNTSLGPLMRITPSSPHSPKSTITFTLLLSLLGSAHKAAGVKNHDKPALIDALRFNIGYALEDTAIGDRPAADILNGYISCERVILRAWNKHRLSDVTADASPESDVDPDHEYSAPLLATAMFFKVEIMELGRKIKAPVFKPQVEATSNQSTTESRKSCNRLSADVSENLISSELASPVPWKKKRRLEFDNVEDSDMDVEPRRKKAKVVSRMPFQTSKTRPFAPRATRPSQLIVIDDSDDDKGM